MSAKLNILFVTIDGGGNLPPVFGLAKNLAQRGHAIQFLTEPCLEQPVTEMRFQFMPFTDYFTRTDRKEDILVDHDASPLSNPVLDNIVFGPVQTLIDQTIDAIKKTDADILMVDLLLLPALIAAEYLQIPKVLVFHMPEYLPGPNRPPGMMGLLPGTGIIGKFRDRLLGKLFNIAFNKHLSRLNEIRRSLQLDTLQNTTDLIDLADLRLIQTLKSFDFPLEPAPSNVRYTGSVLDDPDWVTPWDSPWPEDDPRPLVVISLSSTFQNQQEAIQNAIDALRGLDVRGLVTLGLAMDQEKFDAPQNVVIVKSAPHSQVFPQANLVITHAGHGTIMRSLANGLPLICLPMGRDQNDNAAKVAYHGCGISLNKKASSSTIRAAVMQLLNDPAFRQNALRFQEEIRTYSKKDIATEEIEGLVGRPVAAETV